MTLIELALLLLPAIHPAALRQPEAREIATAVAQAISIDEEEPITGSKSGDLALALVFVAGESMFRTTDSMGKCLAGDGGRALGPFQLQHTPRELACATTTAARLWLMMAHASTRRCFGLKPEERLAALASGNCGAGRAISRARINAARMALASIQP